MRVRLLSLSLLAACGPASPAPPDAGAPACASAPKSPANLAPNAEFECEGAAGTFSTLDPSATITLGDGRSGRGLRLTTSAGAFGNRFASTWKVTAQTAGTYCLTAFIKSTSTATVLRFYGAPPGQAAGNMFTMPGPVTGWSKVPPTIKLDVTVNAGDELFVELTDRTSTAGTVIELDDLDLWQSPGARCDEAR